MISVCEWEREGCEDRGWWALSKVRVAVGPAVMWFTRRELGAWCSLARVAAAGLCHTALIAPRDRPVRAGSDLQPTHIAALLWMDQTRGNAVLSPLSLSFPCQEFNFMRLFTAAYSSFFSPSLASFFPPAAGVCAFDRGDVLACLQRLRHKNGSGNSGSTLFRVPPLAWQ